MIYIIHATDKPRKNLQWCGKLGAHVRAAHYLASTEVYYPYGTRAISPPSQEFPK
jgi:hypothetical protein